MQDLIILASGDNDLMKFLFVGIWILVVFGGVIMKMLGLTKDESSKSTQSQRPRPKFSGNSSESEDMARARQRLQEMIRERKAQEGDMFGTNYGQIRPVFEEEGEIYEDYDASINNTPQNSYEQSSSRHANSSSQSRNSSQTVSQSRNSSYPTQTTQSNQSTSYLSQSNSSSSTSQKTTSNASDEAYAQNTFDYDQELKETQKLLAESEIAFNKVANNTPFCNTNNIDEIGTDIKSTEIRDFVHNKTLLKKSIVISEILDKPLSLR